MALKIKKSVWLGQGQHFVPGQEKQLLTIVKTKKERKALVDRGILVEEGVEEEPPAEDEDEEGEKVPEGEGNTPWKGKK